jgi:hypothetical protein
MKGYIQLRKRCVDMPWTMDSATMNQLLSQIFEIQQHFNFLVLVFKSFNYKLFELQSLQCIIDEKS